MVAQNPSVHRKNFFAELKRRNLYKVAVAYAVVGWLLVQVATQVFPFFEIPNWTVRLVVLAILIGFPIALLIAWPFEMSKQASRTRTCSTRRTVWRLPGSNDRCHSSGTADRDGRRCRFISRSPALCAAKGQSSSTTQTHG